MESKTNSTELPPSPAKGGIISSARSGGSSSVDKMESKPIFDKKMALKVDLYLLVPMLFLNFLSLMGRTNIGAALIQGLPKELKLDAMKVFLTISISLVPLILFEIPSNLLMRFLERKFNFSYTRYLSAITILLGLVTLSQGFDKSYSAILATRFVVGICDAGLIPGCVFVCSLYYPAARLQWRMSMLMVANIASNIISNILAYAIANIKSSNYKGWRWIFIVEGCLTMGIGLACLYSNVSRPETAKFLTPGEKEIVAREVEERCTTIGLVAEWRIFFANPLNYVWAACYVLTCSTTYSVAIFAPSFVGSFHPHYTVPQIQGQVIPIFVVSAAVCLISAWLSDRYNQRASFAIAGYIVTMIGFIILREQTLTVKPSIAMLGLYFVSIVTYTSLPLLWNLTLINLPTPLQRLIGCGFVIGVGNVGGFTSAWLFRTSEAPHYHAGMTDSLIFTAVSAGLILFAWVYIIFANKRSEKREQAGVGGTEQVHRFRV